MIDVIIKVLSICLHNMKKKPKKMNKQMKKGDQSLMNYD